MDPESPRAKPYRRTAIVTTWPSAAANAGEGKHIDDYEDPLFALSKPAGWVVSAVTTQAELISSFALSLSYPFLSLFFQSRAVPSRVAHIARAALSRLALGLLGAAFAVAILIFVMALAFLLGVSLVRLWLEEPVLLRLPLYFDYTQPEPPAAAVLGGAGMRGRAVPAGHMVSVSLSLLMPDSGFNSHVGVFQVSSEAISSNGGVIAASSQPCMLRFSSLPVRLMRTFAMALPLLIGVHTESQQVVFEILRYNEGTQKTEAIRVRITPRAGTSNLPQIYDAGILLRTRLPRRKEVVYNWKWTSYVLVSLQMYVLLLILLFLCFKPFELFRPRMDRPHEQIAEADQDRGLPSAGDVKISEEFTGALRRWRERSRRKDLHEHARTTYPEFGRGSASSIAGETRELIEDSGDCADSESSVCVDD